jgi:hypothetical protein
VHGVDEEELGDSKEFADIEVEEICSDIFLEAVETAKADVAEDETLAFPLLFLLGFLGLISDSRGTILSRNIAAPLLSMMFDSASAANRFSTLTGAGARE